MKIILNFEKIKLVVEIVEKNCFGCVINDNVGYFCVNYMNVVGFWINNVRCIGDNIIF